MPIFHPNSLSKSALEEKQQIFKAQDLQTLEKCALALELVGRLRKEGLDFIFKGGTSLMLLFDVPKRLSIDVDILCLEPLEKLGEVLDRVVTEAPFNNWNHQNLRDREAPPTKHFQVYYEPIVPQARAPSIQIDVIECDSPYAQLVEQPVRVSFLDLVEEIKVPMPSASCLLGDKLAAFAPSTIGYLYQPISRGGRETEPRPIKVLKHLFDLGVLAELGENMADAIASYERIFEEQLKFRADVFQQRGIEMTPDLALDDSQDAAFWAARVGGRRLPTNEDKLTFMQSGIRALRSHLFTEPFAPAQTRLAAGRATLIAEIVRKGSTDFDLPSALGAPLDAEYINGTKLEGSWADLNTIKGTNTDAYVLWEQAQRLRNILNKKPS
jgi:hypothetical protein